MNASNTASDVLRAPTSLLDSYFARIAYTGTTSRSLATLNAIVQAHVQSIPFENIDVVAGNGINLEIDAIAHKLVHSPRGGLLFRTQHVVGSRVAAARVRARGAFGAGAGWSA